MVATGDLPRHHRRRVALPLRHRPLPVVLVVPPDYRLARVRQGGGDTEVARRSVMMSKSRLRECSPMTPDVLRIDGRGAGTIPSQDAA